MQANMSSGVAQFLREHLDLCLLHKQLTLSATYSSFEN